MVADRPIFTVGQAPHWRSRSSITRMNYAFIAALMPAALTGAIAHSFGSKATDMAAPTGPLSRILEILVVESGVNTGVLWLFGIFGLLVMGMAFGTLVEYLCQVCMRQPYYASNGHGALMGLLMVLLMPPTVPWWVLLLGIFLAIFVGKQIFGGIGGYPMHPAMVGWLILLLSWQNHIYPVGMQSIAAVHLAPIIATAAGGIALVALGHIRWQIPAGVLIGVLLASLAFQGKMEGTFYEPLLTGHVVLAAFFLAPDATSSPANRLAMGIYGLGTGFMIILIQIFGIWPDAVPFAVILMNVMVPLLDRIQPRIRKEVVYHG